MWPSARALEHHLKVCQERQMNSDLPADDIDPSQQVHHHILIWVRDTGADHCCRSRRYVLRELLLMFTCLGSCSVTHQISQTRKISFSRRSNSATEAVVYCFLCKINKSCCHSGLNVHTNCWENKRSKACLVQSGQSNNSILVQAVFLETP